MWIIKCDNYILLDDFHSVFDASLDLSLNSAGSLQFTIDPTNEDFNKIKMLKSVVEVYDDGELRFSGRPIKIGYNWCNQAIVTCEGELAYLNDVLIRPFSFPTSSAHTTPADYFKFIIDEYNDKIKPETRRLTLGDIMVRDPNNYTARSDTEYSSAWRLIKEGLLDVYGGFVQIRHGAAGDTDQWGNPAIYIDYIDYNEIVPPETNQAIRFGVNLLNIETERNGVDIATSIIPLGAKNEGTGERLTIASIPDGLVTVADRVLAKQGDVVADPLALAQYGYKEDIVTWDDVTIATNLYNKAKEYCKELWKITSKTKIRAVDLKYVEADINNLHIGDVIPVDSPPHQSIHGFNNECMVTKLHFSLTNPAESTIEVETSVTI